MGGANGGSRNAVPFRVIPDLGQVSEYSSKPSTKERCDVLHDEVVGSKFANQTGVFPPKSGALTVKAAPGTGKADVLARKAAADDVNGDAISGKASCCEDSNIVINRNLGPVLRQHLARVFFDFAEGDGSETAGALQPKAETAYAAEKVEHAVHHASRGE